jgi:hypothetical protein
MYASQINVEHVIRRVIISDLTASPIDTLNLDDLSVLDRATEWYVGVPAIVTAKTLSTCFARYALTTRAI